jgi:hypothetical protein
LRHTFWARRTTTPVYLAIQARTDALWGLAYACEIEPLGSAFVARSVDLGNLVELIAGEDKPAAIVTPALRILGNLVSCEEEITQAVIDAGAIPAFFDIALRPGGKRSLRKESLWVRWRRRVSLADNPLPYVRSRCLCRL